MGPDCHWAIRFLIDSSTAGRTVHSGRVHIWDPCDSPLIMRLCRGAAETPGNVLDSVRLYVSGSGFYEALFGDTIVLNQGDNIWLWCYQYRKAGEWPWTVDTGPGVYDYGQCFLFAGIWENLANYGLDYNWVMELILAPQEVEEGPLPEVLFLRTKGSNPARGPVLIEFGIPLEDMGYISLSVYDISGREVANLLDADLVAGYYRTTWDPGEGPDGLYFLILRVKNRTLNKKLITGGW